MEHEGSEREQNLGARTRIVLADDHCIVRHAIKTILEDSSKFAVVGEAENADEAIDLLTKLHPDILILDISFAGKSGLEALYEIRHLPVKSSVVMLTMYDDDQKVLQAMSAGAKSYLLKNTQPDEFMAALQEVSSGKIFLPKRYEHLRDQIERSIESASGSHSREHPESRTADPLGKLSKREREIFYLLADGLPNRVIAKKLFISPRTVETHRARVLKKMTFNSTADLIRYAIRNNLLTL